MTELSAHGIKVKKYYEAGYWNKQMVYNVTTKGYITPEEYEIIIGEPYAAAN